MNTNCAIYYTGYWLFKHHKGMFDGNHFVEIKYVQILLFLLLCTITFVQLVESLFKYYYKHMRVCLNELTLPHSDFDLAKSNIKFQVIYIQNLYVEPYEG